MIIILAIALLFAFWILLKKPSHYRNWEIGQDRLPKIEISENEVLVENFRDFDWQGNSTDFNIYKTEKFDLDKIKGVEVVISYFYKKFKGLAHISLVFNFSDDRNLAISLESRRERGESFSPLWGFFRKYEIIYVMGSERDVVGLRTDKRKEKVFIFPTMIKAQEAREIFLSIVKDINSIYNQPAFYNSLFNNCNKVVTKNIAGVLKIRFPFSYKTIFPGFMPEVLSEFDLIKNDKSLNDL